MAQARTITLNTSTGKCYLGQVKKELNGASLPMPEWGGGLLYGPVDNYIIYKGYNASFLGRVDGAVHHTSYSRLQIYGSYNTGLGEYSLLNRNPTAYQPQYKVAKNYWCYEDSSIACKFVYSWRGFKTADGKDVSMYRILSAKYEANPPSINWDGFYVNPLHIGYLTNEEQSQDNSGGFSKCVRNMPLYFLPCVCAIDATDDTFTSYIILILCKMSDGHWYLNTQGLFKGDFPTTVTPKSGDYKEDEFPEYGDDDDPSTPDNDDNPYSDGGDSDGGGGGGDYDPSGDGDDEDPAGTDPPNVSIQDTAFCTIFNPSLAQLKALASFMWSNSFYDNILKLWADPFDVILGLSMVPFAVPDGASGVVKVGNVSTGVTMTKAASQYVEVDCGSVTLSEYFGSYLDYSPYTKLSIYLPFVGIKPLGDECMKSKISVKYNCDIVSGACVCFIRVSSSNNGVLYTYQGQCAENIPVTGENFTRLLQSTMSLAGAAGLALATGGASAPISAAMIAGGLASSASAVASGKPDFERSGNISGPAGFMGIQYPYIIIERPTQQVARGENLFTGYPSHETVQIKQCHYFSAFENVMLDGVKCTEAEKEELLQLLSEGVILPL